MSSPADRKNASANFLAAAIAMAEAYTPSMPASLVSENARAHDEGSVVREVQNRFIEQLREAKTRCEQKSAEASQRLALSPNPEPAFARRDAVGYAKAAEVLQTILDGKEVT
jgi:hypothetical protein